MFQKLYEDLRVSYENSARTMRCSNGKQSTWKLQETCGEFIRSIKTDLYGAIGQNESEALCDDKLYNRRC